MTQSHQDSSIRLRQLMEHAEFVKRLARSLVSRPDAADDLMQETWLAAVENPPRNPEASVAWIRRAMRNIACRVRRGDHRRERRERSIPSPGEAEPTVDVVSRLSLQQEVAQAVLALDEPYRTTLLMRYLDDLSPQQIARQQRVSINTVRARLYRARRKIRDEFAARYGEQEWRFAVLAAGGLNPASATTAEVAAAGVLRLSEWSLWMMKAKSFAAVAIATLLCAAVSLMMASNRPESTGDLVHDVATAEMSRAPLAVGPESLPEAADEGDTGDPLRVPVSYDDRQAVERAAVEFTVTGEMGWVRVVPRFESDVVAPRRVIARFMSADRFGEGTDDVGETDYPLSPGRYDASLSAPGFEPSQVTDVAVKPHETTDLGPVLLAAGRSEIVGRVAAYGFDPSEPFTVRLDGDGRRPCLRCGDDAVSADGENGGDVSAAAWERSSPCATCGFASDSSVVTVLPGEFFHFVGLASGTYRLRAFDEERQPVGTECVVALAARDRRLVDLAIPRTVDVTVALRDEVGAPLTGRTRSASEGEEGRIDLPVVHFEFRRADGGEPIARASVIGSLRRTDRVVFHQVQQQLAIRSTLKLSRSIQLGWIVGDRVVQGAAMDPRLDRDRTEEDSLIPAASTPPPPPVATLTGLLDPAEPDLYRVERVPAEALEMRVTCGPFSSGWIAADLRFAAAPRLIAVMRRQDTPTSIEENSEVTQIGWIVPSISEGSEIRLSAGLLTGGTQTVSLQFGDYSTISASEIIIEDP